MISRLGWPHENPVGWIFTSAGSFIRALMFLIVAGYYREKFSSIHKPIAKLIYVLLIACSIAGFLLGAIPNFNTPDKIFMRIHAINAFILFPGLYLTSFFMAVLMAFSRKLTRNRISLPRKVPIIYFIVLLYGATCMFLLLAFAIGLEGQFIFDPLIPAILQPPVWEWQCFMAELFLLVVPAYVLPEKIDLV